MKKILTIALCFLMLSGCCSTSRYYNYYDCEVVDIQEQIITILSEDGNLWDWEIPISAESGVEAEDFFYVGQPVALKMDSRWTKKVEDDIIVDIWR